MSTEEKIQSADLRIANTLHLSDRRSYCGLSYGNLSAKITFSTMSKSSKLDLKSKFEPPTEFRQQSEPKPCQPEASLGHNTVV
ncbi:hypothetical protein T265_01599 [Opisthorchis viverrini]|uniref:Uncharacterized protein n=1 Tax=Opisthorchis viverrini TaxID=6198 RepID=A0A075A298_OPIVI|nr:hypothetical protein T265_01599 [Opisthorchis viverrini]KER32377.1 hypothetical protein T265_01599 [Opisthorchis viverrini]